MTSPTKVRVRVEAPFPVSATDSHDDLAAVATAAFARAGRACRAAVEAATAVLNEPS